MVSNFCNILLKYFLKGLELLTYAVHFYAPLQRKIDLPPIRNEILKISATKLIQKLKNKQIKSVEIIEAYINRIKDVNPIINGVVQDRYEDAIREAREVDEIISKSKDLGLLFNERPLLGLPLSVKETIAVKGMSNNGARSRIESNIAESDSTVVARLRNAGAIPIIVTNTPELCLYYETFNPKIGRTVNPYDTRRTPGGSSGGEAALIASAASLIGVGSDIAGSIRIPASFCGIYGHKPTPGYIPNQGHIPSSTDPDWDKYFTLGPITRYAEDLPLMFNTMANKDKIYKLKLNEMVDVSKIKVYYMYGEGSQSVLQDEPVYKVKKALKDAVDALADNYNCSTEEVQLSCARESISMATLIMRMKGIENAQQIDEDPDNWGLLDALNVIWKKMTFRSSASTSVVMWGPMKLMINNFSQDYIEKAKKQRDHCRKVLMDLLKDNAVLIYPTFPWEAQYHDTMVCQSMNVSYCTLFTTTGLPVSQVPAEIAENGLPIGVQVVAGPHQDRLCFAVAKAIEKVHVGWTAPGE